MPSNTEPPARPDPDALARWLAPFDSQRWLVGFSGGGDSTALLYLLARIPAPRPPLLAIHVHHNLHPDADHWAEHCQQHCQQLGVPLQVTRVQVKSLGRGLEAAARQARYQAFDQHLQAGDALLLAHHQDDLAETLLLNLFRGAGLHGLTSLQPARPYRDGWLLRPLLGMPRAELQQWLRNEGIGWLEDPANENPAFRRNWIRQQLLPQIRQHWPQASRQLAQTARHLQDARQVLDDQAAEALARLAESQPPHRLHCQALARLQPAMQRQCLRLWLKQHTGHYPSRAKLLEILQAALHGPGHFAIPCASQEVIGWNRALYLIQPAALSPDWSARWNGQNPLELPQGCGQLQLSGSMPKAMNWHVHIRQGGERIRLPGRKHHHQLKKLLQAARIPPWERQRMPIIVAENGSLLAAGDQWLSAEMAQWLKSHRLSLHWHRPWQGRTMRPASTESPT